MTAGVLYEYVGGADQLRLPGGQLLVRHRPIPLTGPAADAAAAHPHVRVHHPAPGRPRPARPTAGGPAAAEPVTATDTTSPTPTPIEQETETDA